MSIIKTENIDVSFGSLHVLKGVSLTVEPKEVVCLIGPSGAGKSTFLRTLNRLEKFDTLSFLLPILEYHNYLRKL